MTTINFEKKVGQRVCPCCDILAAAIEVPVGSKSLCPRCDQTLSSPKRMSVERTFALSLTGLSLFVPANLLPTLGIRVLGNHHEGTLMDGVLALYEEGMWIIALLVFGASIFFPLLKLTLSFIISAGLYFGWHYSPLKACLRFMHHLDEWAMLEVYTLGIIVACVKLMGVAELKFGLGLYSFVGLLLVTSLLSTVFDAEEFWHRLEEAEQQNE